LFTFNIIKYIANSYTFYTYLSHPKYNSSLGHEQYAADFWSNHLDVFHGVNNARYARIFRYVERDDRFSFYAQVQLRQQVMSLDL
jgi:hypothetical protein